MFVSLVAISGALFVLGAVIGSFLNVLIYRSLDKESLKRGDSWLTGRSRCDDCRRQIAWYDNIPLLSFLVLGGRCRYCKSQIGLNHLVVELLTGTLFVWWYWAGITFFQLTKTPFGVFQPLFWLTVGIILLYIFLTDAWYFIIPDTAVTALLGITILYRLALVFSGIMQARDLGIAVLCAAGAALTLGLLWVGTKGKGMGFGDVKLMIPLGLLLGWPGTLVMLFAAFVLGGVYGVWALLTKRKKLGQVVPFGPFLIIGTWLSLVWGDQLFASYLRILGL